MYSRATAGDRHNNDKFSPCSYGNITGVLRQKRKCFVSSDAPICGNQIVDQNEECDCGFKALMGLIWTNLYVSNEQ